MRDSILKSVDKVGRLSVPKDLRELACISENTTVAMCKKDSSNGVMLKLLCNIKDCKIIAITKFDEKGRFVYPKNLLEDYEQIFDIYVLNGDIHIEEIE